MPVQMELSRIIISEINEQQVIYLKEVDGDVKIRFARRQPLGERERIPRLDQHVQPPALDLRALGLRLRGELDQVGHRVGHVAVMFSPFP